MLPDERMVEAAAKSLAPDEVTWTTRRDVLLADARVALQEGIAALDREALIEAGAHALRSMPTEDCGVWRREAETVLRAVGLIA